MNRTGHAFRLIVVRRGNQGELFEVGDSGPYRDTVVVSNRNESAAVTMVWYGQRGAAMALFESIRHRCWVLAVRGAT